MLDDNARLSFGVPSHPKGIGLDQGQGDKSSSSQTQCG